jgi:ElaB/YqjD/DUF883 family membrane-anchored ribosome-binding protein
MGDRKTDRQLTVEEAKAGLRETASRVKLSGWIRENPWEAVVGGAVTGLLLGSSRRARKATCSGLSRLLERTLW